MLEEDVTHAFMIIEQVNSDRHDEMEAALDELGQMVTAELGGTCTKYIANAQTPEIVIEE
jgi:DNA/RNA-binding domain of Phe-tRNA-synthetase-like protein